MIMILNSHFFIEVVIQTILVKKLENKSLFWKGDVILSFFLLIIKLNKKLIYIIFRLIIYLY